MHVRANRRQGSRLCVAAALLVASTTLNAETAIKPKAAEPPLDPSVLHQQQPWALSPPVTGSDVPTKRVRTLTIRPDAAPEPAPSGHYYVQLTAQRTSQEAQDRFDELKERFPAALGRYQTVIMRTDAGLSTVYRAVVGPFEDLPHADEMCTGLKAQGGQCVVHRIE
jgi:hypothetical protein